MKSEIYLLKANFLSPKQIQAVYALYLDSYQASMFPISGKWTESNFAAKADHEFFVIAHIDNQIKGFLFFSQLNEDELEIWNLSVHPSFWGNGLSDELVKFLQEDSGLKYRHILLEVHEHNKPALALYTRNGWEITRRRRGYYQDLGDAVLMTYLRRN